MSPEHQVARQIHAGAGRRRLGSAFSYAASGCRPTVLGTQTSHHGGGGKAYLGIKLTLSHLSEAISIAESTRYKDSAALLATRMSLDRGVENAIEQIELLH